MKKIFTLIATFLFFGNLIAQAPQKMSYQAVIRNASGELVVNKDVSVRISILKGSTTGNQVYSELHKTATNGNGLISIEIGDGTNNVGSFSEIAWGTGTYFLKTETDPNNGAEFTISGTSQLLSVPFALFAANGLPTGSTPDQGQTLTWCGGKPNWGPCLPTVTTAGVTQISANAAQGGGNVLDDGGNPVTNRGVVWGVNENPTIANARTFDASGTGSFTSTLNSLVPFTTYFVRAYATNSAGTAYGNQVSFTTIANPPTVVTFNPSVITENSAIGGGQVTNNGGAVVTQRGMVWSNTNSQPTISQNSGISVDGSGNGFFTSNLTSLISGVTYSIRAYAINGAGTSYGNTVTFTTPANTYPSGSVFCNGQQTEVVAVLSPTTNRYWMDRNLGASRSATDPNDEAAYGDLYQWGRFSDGHQCRNNSVVLTGPVAGDRPSVSNNGVFVQVTNVGDWRTVSDNSLWEGINARNNPCPFGFRLPTNTEYQAEINTGVSLLNSPLKLTLAGFRNAQNASFGSVGVYAYYWTSSVTNNSSYMFSFFQNQGRADQDVARAYGFSVRCIKD